MTSAAAGYTGTVRFIVRGTVKERLAARNRFLASTGIDIYSSEPRNPHWVPFTAAEQAALIATRTAVCSPVAPSTYKGLSADGAIQHRHNIEREAENQAQHTCIDCGYYQLHTGDLPVFKRMNGLVQCYACYCNHMTAIEVCRQWARIAAHCEAHPLVLRRDDGSCGVCASDARALESYTLGLLTPTEYESQTGLTAPKLPYGYTCGYCGQDVNFHAATCPHAGIDGARSVLHHAATSPLDAVVRGQDGSWRFRPCDDCGTDAPTYAQFDGSSLCRPCSDSAQLSGVSDIQLLAALNVATGDRLDALMAELDRRTAPRPRTQRMSGEICGLCERPYTGKRYRFALHNEQRFTGCEDCANRPDVKWFRSLDDDNRPRMTTRERKEARIARRQEWAAKAEQRSTARLDAAHNLADMIPLGQPILIGHHSEAHARRDAERIDANMRKGIAESRLATHHEDRAAGIAHQLDTSIYSDDTDAIEQLERRITERTAEVERMKAINATIRKQGFEAAIPLMTPRDIRALGDVAKFQPYYDPAHKGFPPYASTNLRANIRRDQQRLDSLRNG